MEVPRHWRNQRARYRLEGAICLRCERKLMPSQELCPSCGGAELDRYQFSGKGTVYSFSHLVQGPEGFAEQLPYSVALVRLEEGPLLAAQLCDLGDDEARIGMPVEMVTRKLHTDGKDGLIVYGYKFRPVLSDP